jgi:hypothetical protein
VISTHHTRQINRLIMVTARPNWNPVQLVNLKRRIRFPLVLNKI